MAARPEQQKASLDEAWQIAETAWVELQRSPYVQSRMGVAPTRLPDVSFSEAQRRSEVGTRLLKRLDGLDPGALPHELALTLRLVRFRANTWSREADWYWIVVDPNGIGAFGVFLPTAYCGGYFLTAVHNQLAAVTFALPEDIELYLCLVADYARLIEQFTERTMGQAARGIYMPRVQIQQARALVASLKSGVRAALGVQPQRLVEVGAGGFSRRLEDHIAADVEPALERLLECLSEVYWAKAPERVGIGQYPGGSEVYAELVKLYTTLDLSPENVHAVGVQRMQEIDASMREIRKELNFKGDGPAFLSHLDQQSRWRADTAEGVTAVFQRYIDRIQPHLRHVFATLPKASCDVAPLPVVLQASMTFGYYDAPRKDRAEGRYLFNSGNMTRQSLFNVAALTYHELLPGHHLQLGLQQENGRLHPFSAHSFVTAYIEGWAEYAATLAGELGMYELPEERYGRLIMDALFTCRLVVDTGMNVLGWSLERAREYLRVRSGLPEAAILTESVRYSCDYVGQALAYKIGDTEILTMRQRMRSALGVQFDLKEFHTAILSQGALPMPDLRWHLDQSAKRLIQRRCGDETSVNFDSGE